MNDNDIKPLKKQEYKKPDQEKKERKPSLKQIFKIPSSKQKKKSNLKL